MTQQTVVTVSVANRQWCRTTRGTSDPNAAMPVHPDHQRQTNKLVPLINNMVSWNMPGHIACSVYHIGLQLGLGLALRWGLRLRLRQDICIAACHK